MTFVVTLVVFRASEAVKQMELSQKHEAEETAALEKMMQKVEANLEVTTVIIVILITRSGQRSQTLTKTGPAIWCTQPISCSSL